MVKNVFDATKTLQLAVGRVELQKDVSRNPTSMKSFFDHVPQRYEEWRDIWRSDDGGKDTKFEAYAKSNPDSAKRVLRQLALLSQALFDVDALEEEYGFKQNEIPTRVREHTKSTWYPIANIQRSQKTSPSSVSKKEKTSRLRLRTLFQTVANSTCPSSKDASLSSKRKTCSGRA